ncbi:MAG: hypothetical protein HYT47_00365 [Candidatus Vogelbacteria bacterium]|nr:hypothetical protein [Candidatus Vogelbacteria bacterium]
MRKKRQPSQKYTPEQEAYLKQVDPPLSWLRADRARLETVAQEFNERFGTSRSARALVLKQRQLLGLAPSRKQTKRAARLTLTRNSRHSVTHYTSEMDQLIVNLAQNRKLDWPKRTRWFNRTFGTATTPKALREHYYGKLHRRIERNSLVPHGFRVMVGGRIVWQGKERPAVTIEETKILGTL